MIGINRQKKRNLSRASLPKSKNEEKKIKSRPKKSRAS